MPLTAPAPTLTDKLVAARDASSVLATATTAVKDAALRAIAASVRQATDEIVRANHDDLVAGEENGLSSGLLDRLRLDPARIDALAAAVEHVVGLTDPVGQHVRGSRLPNGLQLSQVRVPFGVVGAIYEARPNVTVDIASLALKSGNAVVLRGGSARSGPMRCWSPASRTRSPRRGSRVNSCRRSTSSGVPVRRS